MIAALAQGAVDVVNLVGGWCVLVALVRDHYADARRRAMLRDVSASIRAEIARLSSGDAMAPAPEARPAAWLAPGALDDAALADVRAALMRLIPITGQHPTPADCAAMLMLISAAQGRPIVGQGERFDLCERAAAAARRHQARKGGGAS